MTHLLAILLSFAVLISWTDQEIIYRCHMDGQDHRTCCCLSLVKAFGNDRDAHVSRGCCCDVQVITHQKQLALAGSVPDVQPVSVAVVYRMEIPPIIQRHSTVMTRPSFARGPPGKSPPRFILYCSYLI